MQPHKNCIEIKVETTFVQTFEKYGFWAIVLCLCYRAYFPERNCFVFPPPANTTDKMNNLDKLPEAELEPDFVLSGNKFTEFIMKNARSQR